MLEQPFGVEAADISLLSIGAEVADDLDGMLRTAEKAAARAPWSGRGGPGMNSQLAAGRGPPHS